ncbi:MAG: SRPBCC family protein [Actinobacteria bacterium]|nr:SRPBCC family protein [Actinomycetota bacterium]MBW3646235.1 SRPBCC family protein [Actinomycetota bacterium]
MKLENRFTVAVPVDEAWQVLLDVERIAPCMPGAALTRIEGDHFEGTVKVKVGPINLTYGGKASFVSKDEAGHVVVIDGSGKETRGTGTAKALITCRLVADGDSTQVEVDTDLNVTGKPAQFGRGVLAEVSGKLVDRFAACLSEEILAGSPEPVFAATAADLGAPEGVDPPAVSVAPPAMPRPPAEAIDLLDAAGAPVLKRLAPALAALVVLLLLVRKLRR